LPSSTEFICIGFICVQEEGWLVCRAFQKPMPNQQQRHGCYAGGFPAGYPSVPTYYYDGSNAAAHARLLMSGAAAPALHDHHSLAAESKLQVHLLADMPPLQSPALEAAGQSYEQPAAGGAA
jgi:hypothetical protein